MRQGSCWSEARSSPSGRGRYSFGTRSPKCKTARFGCTACTSRRMGMRALSACSTRTASESSCSTGARSTNWTGETRQGPLTLVPLSAYFKDGRAKVELALARGRRAYDKRRAIAERDVQIELRRELGRGGPALGVIDEETPKRASGRPPTIAGPTVTRPVTSEGSGKHRLAQGRPVPRMTLLI